MKRPGLLLSAVAMLFGGLVVACSSADADTASNVSGTGVGGAGAPGSGGASGAGVGGDGGNSPSGGGSLNLGGAPADGGTTPSCAAAPTEDSDGDGFTGQDGDCNDCDKNANPGAYDVADNAVDEDCNGAPDNTPVDCDQTITDIASTDPMQAAFAIGLCQKASATDKKWGVLVAKYVEANGTAFDPAHDSGHGLLTGFGPNVNVQEGKRMLVLSSGTARQPTDPGYQSPSGFSTAASSPCPTGFPIESPTCGKTVSGQTANDPAGLQLRIRVPTNAKSFSFKFNFYTFEWPNYVCSTYNDFFVALLNPAADPQPPQYANISFDSKGNPVSVNNALLGACGCANGPPCVANQKTFACKLGTKILEGTGFKSHAATGWLETVSPVTPGSEMVLRYAIWDAGDHILDSTVLIDSFQFSAEEATGTVTTPVPTPR